MPKNRNWATRLFGKYRVGKAVMIRNKEGEGMASFATREDAEGWLNHMKSLHPGWNDCRIEETT